MLLRKVSVEFAKVTTIKHCSLEWVVRGRRWEEELKQQKLNFPHFWRLESKLR